MQNITQYTSQELSLLFLNDESLYTVLRRAARKNDFSEVKEVARECFIYTFEQLEDLEETFSNEVEEIEDENED